MQSFVSPMVGQRRELLYFYFSNTCTFLLVLIDTSFAGGAKNAIDVSIGRATKEVIYGASRLASHYCRYQRRNRLHHYGLDCKSSSC